MTVALERVCFPESTCIEAIGHKDDYGVVIKYKSGGEYHAPSLNYFDYCNIVNADSVGAALAEKRSLIHKSGRAFYPVDHGSHFPAVYIHTKDKPHPRDLDKVEADWGPPLAKNRNDNELADAVLTLLFGPKKGAK